MIDTLVARVLAAPPHCGTTKLVCVDGPSAAGKTQLAAALATALGNPPVVVMDELYPGWDGLVAGVARLRTEVVAPLAAGQAAAYRRWDWARDTYGERREHCFTGDTEQPNNVGNRTVHQRYMPAMAQWMMKTAPAGADTKSWAY